MKLWTSCDVEQFRIHVCRCKNDRASDELFGDYVAALFDEIGVSELLTTKLT